MLRGITGTPEADIVAIGPRNIEMVPRQVINELPQVRTFYNPEAIRELADAIRSGDEGLVDGTLFDEGRLADAARFHLISPLSAALHTKKSARDYLRDHGDFYKIPAKDRLSVDDLVPYDDDMAVILIAGHRRKRAIDLLLEEAGIEPFRVQIATQLYPTIPFAEAIMLQTRENTYEKPPAYDEARAIELAYNYERSRTGSAPSIKKLAGKLGFSETKVRDALEFASLPSEIQEFATDGRLSYTTVRRLKPLYDAYMYLYRRQPKKQRESGARNQVEAFCHVNLIKILKSKNEGKLEDVIAKRVKEVLGEAAYQHCEQDELFFLNGYEAPSQVAARTGRELARVALRVVSSAVRADANDGSAGTAGDRKYSDAELLELYEATQAALAQRSLLGVELAEAEAPALDPTLALL